MEDEAKASRSLDRLIQIYQYMMETRASEKSLEYVKFGRQEDNLWQGNVRDIAIAIGEPNIQSVYNALTTLDTMECINRISRGSARTNPVYVLVREPSGEDYYNLRNRSAVLGQIRIPNAASRNRYSIVAVNRDIHQVQEYATILERRIERLERVVEDITLRISSERDGIR